MVKISANNIGGPIYRSVSSINIQTPVLFTNGKTGLRALKWKHYFRDKLFRTS